MQPRVSIVAAIGRNRELGRAGGLLWHIPEDLRRFKALTLGHPVVMGRTTFESITKMLGKPLPERTNIVLTRDTRVRELLGEHVHPDVYIANSPEEALAKAKSLDEKEIFIIGGAQIYQELLPRTDRLYLTLIEAEALEADAYFPAYESIFTKKILDEEREFDGLRYRWVDLERE